MAWTDKVLLNLFYFAVLAAISAAIGAKSRKLRDLARREAEPTGSQVVAAKGLDSEPRGTEEP